MIGSEIISASQHGTQVTPPPVLYLFFFVCHELIHQCLPTRYAGHAPSLHHVLFFLNVFSSMILSFVQF